MASAAVIKVDPTHALVAGAPKLSQESANELSNLMQENHEKHHIFFNDRSFHNHIAHHLLTVYALGATPVQLQHAYRYNARYQRPQLAPQPDMQAKFADPDAFLAAIGSSDNYHDFLIFFTAEISARGIGPVLEEYIFKGDARANAMYVRLYASLLHSFIHLGLALEFGIPSMVAEALAWIAVHQDEVGDFVRKAASLAKDSPAPSPARSLIDLFRAEMTPEIQGGVTAATFMKGGSLYTEAEPKVAALAASYRVAPENIEERTLETINIITYLTMGAQRPPYTPKVDFFNVHMMNATVFLPALVRQLAPLHAARLLEGLVRSCLLTFAAAGAPDMHIDYILSFARDPARRAKQYLGTVYPDWESIFAKASSMDDDGHVSKAVRALRGAELAAGRQTMFEEALKKEDMLDLAAVLMRSVEAEKHVIELPVLINDAWVRLCGFEEGWRKYAKVE